MTEEEYQKFEKDLRQNPLPPLPQRSNRRTNKQVTLSESPPPEEINDNDNNRNMDTTTTITNIDNTTTITNTISTPVTPTNTTTHIPITTSPFANVLSNMSSYKNNLIQRLLGQQGRAANTTQDNSTAARQLAPLGHVSPVDQVNDKLESLLTSLHQPLEQLANISVTIKNIGDLVSNDIIPSGCIPTCRLGIQNPPADVKETWDKCLLECGKQLTAILISHHDKCHETLLSSINKSIQDEFESIKIEFQSTVPELDSKLTHTKSKTTVLQQEIEDKCIKNRKRGPQSIQPNNPNKRPRFDTDNTIQEQVKSAITEAVGYLLFIPRGRGRGCGRGRGRFRGRGRY